MALANMNRNLEGDGPHDKAGARIFDAYRQWIEAHRDQVMGFDPAVPALAQLDKLTDGQLREIARGLDPLARSEAAKPDRTGPAIEGVEAPASRGSLIPGLPRNKWRTISACCSRP